MCVSIFFCIEIVDFGVENMPDISEKLVKVGTKDNLLGT